MKHSSGFSESISGMVRTIEEVSFRTDLLALNAAVALPRGDHAGADGEAAAREVPCPVRRRVTSRPADLERGSR